MELIMANQKGINVRSALKLKRTGMVKAKIAITADTLIRLNGSATTKQIHEEIQRRLVEPFDGWLKDTHKERHKTELSSQMSAGHGWIDCSGNGVWTLRKDAYCGIWDYLAGSSAFGFESVDEFLDLVDEHSNPIEREAPPATLHQAIKEGLMTPTRSGVDPDDNEKEFDLDADKEYRIDDILALRKELNEGIDKAIKDIIAANNPERARQAHKSLLNGINWAAQEEKDQQIARMTEQCVEMDK